MKVLTVCHTILGPIDIVVLIIRQNHVSYFWLCGIFQCRLGNTFYKWELWLASFWVMSKCGMVGSKSMKKKWTVYFCFCFIIANIFSTNILTKETCDTVSLLAKVFNALSKKIYGKNKITSPKWFFIPPFAFENQKLGDHSAPVSISGCHLGQATIHRYKCHSEDTF